MQLLLRQILNSRRSSEESDAELLRQFADRRDGDAFARLVDRYGGLVWGQCRHLLANEADAEDAFQATFLVLARHAKSIRAVDRLGPWLHGVAFRVCQNARRQAARRARREQVAATPEASRPVADSAWDALLAAVHEELHALPEKLREAFILCYLEGKTTSQAAEQLGLKLGTFSARLSRAKEQLLARLEARNLASGAGLVAALPGGPASAALVRRAVELAIAPAGVPAALLSLTQGVVLMGMKLKVVTACVLMAGVLALGGLWSLQAQPGPEGLGSKLPGTGEGQPDLPQIRREIEQLRAQIAAKEQQLAAQEALRRAELERDKLLRDREQKSEFRYHIQHAGYAPTPAELEKTVHEIEKEGYRFVGIITMTMDEKAPGGPGPGPGTGGPGIGPRPGGPGGGVGPGPRGPATAGVPTLVFRKLPATDRNPGGPPRPPGGADNRPQEPGTTPRP
jgi:RNA polymerase sigma factor (sigma-70 family)